MLRHIEHYLTVSIAGSFFFGGLAAGQGPTLIFPQIADGGTIRLEIVLTNPAGQEDKGTIFFKGENGQALPLVINGASVDSVAYSIDPGGVFKIETDGVGNAQAGYAIVLSENVNSEITGVIIYNVSGFEVSVPNSPLSSEYHVFAERNSTSNSGVAFANPGDKGITILVFLLDREGKMVDEVEIDLLSSQQLPRFINEIFDGIDLDFQGSIHARSDDEFSMVGLRQKTNGSLATLSGSSTAFPAGGVAEDACANGTAKRS